MADKQQKEAVTSKPTASQQDKSPTKGPKTMTAARYKKTVARRLNYERSSDLPLSEKVLEKKALRRFDSTELTEKQWATLHKPLNHLRQGGD